MTDTTQEPWGGIALTTWRDESNNATVYVITVTDRHEIEHDPEWGVRESYLDLWNYWNSKIKTMQDDERFAGTNTP